MEKSVVDVGLGMTPVDPDPLDHSRNKEEPLSQWEEELLPPAEVTIRPVIPLKQLDGNYIYILVPESPLDDYNSLNSSPVSLPDKLSGEDVRSTKEAGSLEVNCETTELEAPLDWASVSRKSLYRVIVTHDYGLGESVPPRGLINNSNMCFLNSILQILVHCRPFYLLLKDIKTHTTFQIKSPTPVLDGLVAFAGQYSMPGVGKGHNRLLNAENFYKVICSQPNFKHLQPGRQEDAQEFMSLLFDTLERNFDAAEPTAEDKTELLSTSKTYSEFNNLTEEENDGWTEVGKDSKPIKARQTGRQDYNNPILELFGGRLRSVLRKKGKTPSITADPFQQVPVDISNEEVTTLQEALDHMCAEEELNLEEGSIATKRLEFDRTPPILILHLKRFTFIRQGNSFEFGKISKPIAINKNLRAGHTNYRPFGIVYHHGPSATMGHYTADVLIDEQWHRVDDDYVSQTPSPVHDISIDESINTKPQDSALSSQSSNGSKNALKNGSKLTLKNGSSVQAVADRKSDVNPQSGSRSPTGTQTQNNHGSKAAYIVFLEQVPS